MQEYEPELGQFRFGQPWKRYKCPEWLVAYLEYIGRELERVMWNINQEEYSSPFSNTGNSFKNDVFEAEAYSWGDELQPYNFKWKDVEISWYKYLGRGTSVNQKIGHNKAEKMLNECLESIRAMEPEL